MREKKRRWMIARLAVAGIVAGSTGMVPVHASESLPKAGMEVLREQYETEYSPIVFANVDPFIYIRSEARESAGYQGKLYKEGAASVIGKQGEWLEVVSGDVRGYVRKSEMLMGEQAKKKAKEAGKIAEVTADILNVRKGMGTDTEIIGQLKKGEKKEIQGEADTGWIPIQYEGREGFISELYAKTEAQFTYAESKEEEQRVIAGEKGKKVVEYACKFIGNPYVWGGTSLTEGADCSGFVQSVYKNFNEELPRTTWDMEQVGEEVGYEEIIPGDLVLYDGHVGIYVGEDKMVNAIDEENGIGISPVFLNEIITIRRIL